MKRRIWVAGAVLAVIGGLSMLGMPQQASAMAHFSATDATYVKKDQVVDGSAYVTGTSITIDGTIKGDLYCAGQDVTITGVVDGDIICAGKTIEVSGRSGGSMRLAGETVRLRGESKGSVSVFASDFETENTTKVGGDLNGVMGTATLAGVYGRDVTISATDVTVVGAIARDVEGDYATLRVAKGGSVAGALSYTSANEAVIDGSVSGKVTRYESNQSGSAAAIWSLIGLALIVVIGVLLAIVSVAFLIPRRMDEAAAFALKQPARAIVWGAGIAVALPIVTLILMLTGVGAILAIVLLVAWAFMSMLGGIFAAYFVGKVTFKKVRSVPLRALLGGILIAVVSLIPLVNIAVFMAISVFGTGMVMAYLEHRRVFERRAV